VTGIPSFSYRRCVDLSRPLDPEGEQHPWVRYATRIDSIVDDPESVPPSGRWYVVTQIAMSGHAGTHVEAPLHAVENGSDVGKLAVERFFGEAAILDLGDVPWSEPFDQARLEKAARPAGGIHPNDIVFIHFGWDRRSTQGGHPPYPTSAAVSWLVDRGIKLLGIDSPGLELPGNKALVNHHILFDRGIPLIESLTSLDRLEAPRVYVFAVPLPACGTDSIPLRVLAFEGGSESQL